MQSLQGLHVPPHHPTRALQFDILHRVAQKVTYPGLSWEAAARWASPYLKEK